MLLWSLNIRHLRALSAICRLGSVSAAAHAISLSQPAVTQGMARLEQQLGRPLFERRSDGMSPTPAGALLCARVDKAVTHMAAGFRAARGSGSVSGGFADADRLVTMAQLRALIALADAGSYISASAVTGLSQPSLHRAVRELETASGLTLFVRRGRGVAITDAGRTIVRAFRLVRTELQTGLFEIAALEGAAVGRIAIGAMPLARAKLIPRAVARFHQRHPDLRIDIVDGPHGELMEQLRDGDLDFLIGALRFPEPGKDVRQKPLFDDHLVIAARAGHPLAGHGAAQPAATELARFPWVIARAGTPMHRLWEKLFRAEGVEPPAAPVTCGSVLTIRGLLLEGDYVTLLSPDQIARDVESGLVTTIGPPLPGTSRPIGITTRSGWQPTKVQEEFLREIALGVPAIGST